jgi:hypothetical protein
MPALQRRADRLWAELHRAAYPEVLAARRLTATASARHGRPMPGKALLLLAFSRLLPKCRPWPDASEWISDGRARAPWSDGTRRPRDGPRGPCRAAICIVGATLHATYQVRGAQIDARTLARRSPGPGHVSSPRALQGDSTTSRHVLTVQSLERAGQPLRHDQRQVLPQVEDN